MKDKIYLGLILKRSLVLLSAVFTFMPIYTQREAGNAGGTVKDGDGLPLEGVTVTIRESTVTGTTDVNGEFSIPAIVGDHLTFMLEGYETVSKTLGLGETEMEISMTAQLFGARGRDEVPMAYTTGKKRYITAAVSTVSYDDFAKRKDMNIMNGLGGLVNGLVVMSTSWSDGGSTPSFYVRGLKTTNPNNAPLVLIDDVERGFGQLNPNEIASISVLKDAAALAIYGSRGANGVVLVKTKRGLDNKKEITVHSEVGLAQSLRLPKVLDAYDYARLSNKAEALDGNSNLTYSEADLQGYKAVVDGEPGADPFRYPNVDFYSEFLKPVVKQQQHDLTMTGGNDVAKYFALLGYMNQEGLYKYGDNTFDRYNFRTNIDVKLNTSLTVSLDMAGRLENLTVPGGNYAYSIFGQFASTPSNAYPIFNGDGSLGGTANYTDNPYGLMNRMGQRDQTSRYFNADLNFRLDLSKLVEGLGWDAKGGIDFVDGSTSQLTSSEFAVYELLDDGGYTHNGTSDVAKTRNFWFNSKDRQFTFNTSFNYQKNIGNGRVNALALFYLRELNSMGISVPFKTIGTVSKIGYSYLDRYMIDGVVSYTGSENFARGHRYGVFPAVSLGWIVSEEAFLKDNPTITFLKLRASYGMTGLDKPFNDRFLFRENWANVTGYAFGTGGNYRTGTDQVRIGNENLKWETSVKSNIGLDFGFFDNTLLWTIDGFLDRRKDILVQKYATTPSMAGIPLPYENSGETKSWGFDSELVFDKQFNKSWGMAIKGNMMLTRSEIIDIDETFKVDAYQYQKGNPIGQPFGYVSDGFFTEEEIAGYAVKQNDGNIRAGDIKYSDQNNDFVIDGKDTRPIAQGSIPNLIGGLSFSVRYGLIDLSVQAMGMFERSVYMPGVYMNSFDGNGNASVYALEAWTPETSETAIYPRLSIGNNSNNRQYSDFWFRDGSFVKLKSAELGINLPVALARKVGMSKARVYLNGYNLFCWDRVDDFDPEYTNAALYSYPFQRIGTLGVSLTF